MAQGPGQGVSLSHRLKRAWRRFWLRLRVRLGLLHLMARKPDAAALRMVTPIEAVRLAANQRAFEAWVVAQARGIKIPWRAWTSAKIADVEDGSTPTVIVLTGLKGRAWCALGLVHFFAWWKLRANLAGNINGHRVVLWLM